MGGSWGAASTCMCEYTPTASIPWWSCFGVQGRAGLDKRNQLHCMLPRHAFLHQEGSSISERLIVTIYNLLLTNILDLRGG